MTRIRTVKPELFKHDELFDAEIKHQLPLRIAFIGLFTCCDREGRFKWKPRRLKTDILPYDDVDAEQVFNVLADYGFIKKYQHQGEDYGYISSWHKHQHINHRETASVIPSPLENISENSSNSVAPTINETTATIIEKSTIQEETTTVASSLPAVTQQSEVIKTSKPPVELANKIQQIFNHWKIIMEHPEAKLDPQREELITKALKLGYDVNLLCHAISGCRATPYNMGHNDRGERYNGLHIILRDASQIDRFIQHYNKPPSRPTTSTVTQNNAQQIQVWLAKKCEELQNRASG